MQLLHFLVAEESCSRSNPDLRPTNRTTPASTKNGVVVNPRGVSSSWLTKSERSSPHLRRLDESPQQWWGRPFCDLRPCTTSTHNQMVTSRQVFPGTILSLLESLPRLRCCFIFYLPPLPAYRFGGVHSLQCCVPSGWYKCILCFHKNVISLREQGSLS